MTDGKIKGKNGEKDLGPDEVNQLKNLRYRNHGVIDRSNVRDQIINREFDLIIYGRMSPYDPGTINLDDPLNMPIFYREIL